MARGKPAIFNRDQSGRARLENKRIMEAALTPKKSLSIRPPSVIIADPIAAAMWKRLIRIFRSLESDVITTLDQELLTEYCRVVSELAMLRKLRDAAIKAHDLEIVIKLDARVDRKATRLDNLGDRLYLSPRARSGVVPENKPAEPMEPPFQEGSILWSDFVSKGNDENE